jgi:16S rRNA (uracil1498-N3)-methyltransferase
VKTDSPGHFYYASPTSFSASAVTLDGEEFLHLTRVMRARPGDAIIVTDGIGHAYQATVSAVSSRSATCTTHGIAFEEPPVLPQITVAVGMLKNPARYDFMIEKLCELGVHAVIPLVTSRTITRHDKSTRWERIAVAAMKQSERARLTRIMAAMTFSAVLAHASSATLALIPHEKAATPLIHDALRTPDQRSILLCIGPEGGFSDEEIASAVAAGVLPVSLGPHRLRTETAAIMAAVAATLFTSRG